MREPLSNIKILFLLYFVFGNDINLNGQKIYLSNNGLTSHGAFYENVNDLCDYDVTRCPNLNLLFGGYYTDGNLIDMHINQYEDSSNIQFSKFDVNTCSFVFISRLDIHPSKAKVQPYPDLFISDHLGRIYFMLREKSPSCINYICRINNFHDTVIQYLIPIIQCGPAREFIDDILFRKDKIYMYDRFNSKFIICDTLFNRIGVTDVMPVSTPHFLSYPVNCDSSTTYVTFCSDTDNLGNVICFKNAFLGTYNFKSNTVTTICRINISGRNTGYSYLNPISPLEFLTSETECDLLIDLDLDNSSGLFPYDFKPNKSICKENNVAIADSDVYIQTSAPIDSIILILHGIKDPGMEILFRKFTLLGAQLIQLNDSTYVIKGVQSSFMDYTHALINMYYQHTGTVRTPGIRRIEVQGFNSIKSGLKINSFINIISNNPYSGRDTTLIICSTKKITGISKLIGGQPGGKWSPGLVKVTDFDSDLDQGSSYSYITGDSICGMDTATVSIKRGIAITPVNFSIDTILCKGSTFVFGGTTYKDTGKFVSVIRSVQGCDSIIYNLQVRSTTIPPINVRQDKDLCAGDTITLSIDTIYRQISWTRGVTSFGSQSKIRTPQAGEYIVTAIDKNQCKSTDTILVRLFTKPQINVEDMLGLDFMNDRPIAISYSGNPVKYSWTPPAGLSCADCAVPKLLDDQDRRYNITVNNAQNCKANDSLLITYLRASYFMPNAIKLQSQQGGNNNKFYIQGNISGSYDLQIFNRWGSVVFTIKDLIINDPSGGWLPSETGSPPGVYVYKVLLHTVNGDVLKAGDVTVLD